MKGAIKQAQRLDDGGVTEEGEDPLDQHGHDHEDHLGRVTRSETPLDHQYEAGADDEDEAFDLEPDLGHPVEERDRPGPVRPEGGPVDGEDRRPGVGSLQGAQPEQEVGQVADDDQGDGLGEGEPERHQDGAVEEVLGLHAGARPHSEDVPRPGPAFALGDEVDPVLLDRERVVDARVVNDRYVLGDRHRGTSLVVRLVGVVVGCADKATAGSQAAPGSHPRSRIHAPRLSGSVASLASDRRCAATHWVCEGTPRVKCVS